MHFSAFYWNFYFKYKSKIKTNYIIVISVKFWLVKLTNNSFITNLKLSVCHKNDHNIWVILILNFVLLRFINVILL